MSNPSISFEYKYFNEKSGYSDAVKKSKKSHNSEVPVNEQEDYDDSPVKSPVLSALKGVIASAIVVLVVFAALALINGYKSSRPQEVLVPDFVGLTVSDANELNNGGFVFEYENRYSDEFPIDTIIYQTPEAGSKKVKEGSKISLVINSADSEVTIPYVGVNGDLDTTVNQLKSLNLIPQVLYINSDKPVSSVDSLFPPINSKVEIGTTVYVFVSKGPLKEGIEMPDIKGLSATQAQEKLTELGFKNIKLAYDENSKEEKDTVLRHNPVKGSVINEDYNIVITCAKGEEEKEQTISVNLPTDETSEVSVTVLIDGVADNQYTKTLVPSTALTYSFVVKGTDEATVLVLIDGKNYIEYSVNFEDGTINVLNEYGYTVKQPETVDPTDEPTTEPTEG